MPRKRRRKRTQRTLPLVALAAVAGALFFSRGAPPNPVRVEAAIEPAMKEVTPPSGNIESRTIGKGGTLSVALEKLGFGDREVSGIVREFRTVFDPRRSRPSDTLEIRRSGSGDLLEVRYWRNSLKYISVRPAPERGFVASLEDAPFTESVESAQGTITSSLWVALRAQKVPPETIFRFAEVFAWQIDFLTEPRKGDTFSLVWKRRVGRSARVDGGILTARYNGEVTGERTAILFEGRYYDPKGRALHRDFLRAPLDYRRISSRFQRRRYHPVLRRRIPHHGIDYAAAAGTPAVSIGDGEIVKVGWNGPLGRAVFIRHNDTYTSIYGHLARYAPGLRPGMRVAQGDVIGFVGSSGRSTGPHLHFGFKKNGRLVDYFSLKFPEGDPLSDPDEIARFAKERRASLVLLETLPIGPPSIAVATSRSYR